MPRGRGIDAAWLREHYPMMTSVHTLLDDHEREFGWRPTKGAVYQKANKLGIRKTPVAGRDDRAERTIRWAEEPELVAWMDEHDHGQRLDGLRAEFRAAHGYGIARVQVNAYRARYRPETHRSHRRGGRTRVPVGTEREGKGGYVYVKVREESDVPMAKDNWLLKHVWVYEQHHGEVPEDHFVYFADHDRSNFDPDNLVAVPRSLVGVMNNPDAPEWHDRQTLEACIALARVKVATHEAAMRAPRTCAVCGRAFVPDERQRSNPNPPKTCPACLAAGRRTRGGGGPRKYDHDKIRRLHAEGRTYGEIAREIGCTKSTVRAVLVGRRNGV